MFCDVVFKYDVGSCTVRFKQKYDRGISEAKVFPIIPEFRAELQPVIWKFIVPLTSMMDMTTSVRGGKWFLLGLLLLICISAGFAEEDGKNNTASKGFPSICVFLFHLSLILVQIVWY